MYSSTCGCGKTRNSSASIARAGLGHRFRLHHAVDAGHRVLVAGGHRRAHRLGTQHRDLDALLAIGDGQPFRESDRGVLGHRVGRRSDLRQQPGGRSRVEQVAAAAFDHARNQVARRVHMGHQIDVPVALPVIVGHLGSARDRDAGIGAEQVDRAVLALDALYEAPDIVLDGHVDLARDPADLGRHRGRAVAVAVGADHQFGAIEVKTARQRAADTAGRPGHDDTAIFQVHGLLLRLDRRVYQPPLRRRQGPAAGAAASPRIRIAFSAHLWHFPAVSAPPLASSSLGRPARHGIGASGSWQKVFHSCQQYLCSRSRAASSRLSTAS
jgi:hypothetical protein